MPEKTVAQKLQMKPGRRVRFIQPPEDLMTLLGGLPDGASVLDDTAGPDALLPADIIVFFANGSTDLATLLPGLRTALAPDGMIWVAYHKGTSRLKTDIHRDSINNYAKTVGMEGVAMVSINDDWSALRLKVKQDD